MIRLTIVFANRGEDVKYFTRCQGATRVNGVRWDNQDLSGSKHVAVPIDRQLKGSFEHIDDLFVHVGMFGDEAALVNIPVSERHVGRMNKAAMKARKNLPGGQVL